MTVSCIFAERLYSFKYDLHAVCVYHQKLWDWQDFEHIYEKAIENGIDITNIDQFFNEIFFDREYFRKQIEFHANSNELFLLFKSLKNFSSTIESFEQSKAKVFVLPHKRLSRLRLYSLRVNNTCFVITGGAIKFTNEMKDHPDTLAELDALKNGRRFLIDSDFGEDDIIDNLFES